MPWYSAFGRHISTFTASRTAVPPWTTSASGPPTFKPRRPRALTAPRAPPADQPPQAWHPPSFLCPALAQSRPRHRRLFSTCATSSSASASHTATPVEARRRRPRVADSAPSRILPPHQSYTRDSTPPVARHSPPESPPASKSAAGEDQPSHAQATSKHVPPSVLKLIAAAERGETTWASVLEHVESLSVDSKKGEKRDRRALGAVLAAQVRLGDAASARATMTALGEVSGAPPVEYALSLLPSAPPGSRKALLRASLQDQEGWNRQDKAVRMVQSLATEGSTRRAMELLHLAGLPLGARSTRADERTLKRVRNDAPKLYAPIAWIFARRREPLHALRFVRLMAAFSPPSLYPLNDGWSWCVRAAVVASNRVGRPQDALCLVQSLYAPAPPIWSDDVAASVGLAVDDAFRIDDAPLRAVPLDDAMLGSLVQSCIRLLLHDVQAALRCADALVRCSQPRRFRFERRQGQEQLVHLVFGALESLPATTASRALEALLAALLRSRGGGGHGSEAPDDLERYAMLRSPIEGMDGLDFFLWVAYSHGLAERLELRTGVSLDVVRQRLGVGPLSWSATSEAASGGPSSESNDSQTAASLQDDARPGRSGDGEEDATTPRSGSAAHAMAPLPAAASTMPGRGWLSASAYALKLRAYSLLRADAESVRWILRHMHANGVSPNLLHVAPIVEALARSGRVDEAREMRDALLRRRDSPDGWGAREAHVQLGWRERLQQHYERLNQWHRQRDPELDLRQQPAGDERRESDDDSMDAPPRGGDLGPSALLRIHTAVVRGYARAGEALEARRALVEMERDGLAADDALLSMLRRAEAGAASAVASRVEVSRRRQRQAERDGEGEMGRGDRWEARDGGGAKGETSTTTRDARAPLSTPAERRRPAPTVPPQRRAVRRVTREVTSRFQQLVASHRHLEAQRLLETHLAGALSADPSAGVRESGRGAESAASPTTSRAKPKPPGEAGRAVWEHYRYSPADFEVDQVLHDALVRSGHRIRAALGMVRGKDGGEGPRDDDGPGAAPSSMTPSPSHASPFMPTPSANDAGGDGGGGLARGARRHGDEAELRRALAVFQRNREASRRLRGERRRRERHRGERLAALATGLLRRALAPPPPRERFGRVGQVGDEEEGATRREEGGGAILGVRMYEFRAYVPPRGDDAEEAGKSRDLERRPRALLPMATLIRAPLMRHFEEGAGRGTEREEDPRGARGGAGGSESVGEAVGARHGDGEGKDAAASTGAP